MILDAKDQPKDVVPEVQGGDSKDKGSQDSAQPKTYTEDEVEGKFSQQRSVLDKKIDKLEKALSNASDRVKDAEGRLSQWGKDREEAEVAAAGDDKDALSRVRARQEQRETKAELAAVKKELDAEREKAKEASAQAQEIDRTTRAAEIAVRHNVDFNPLVKFTDGSVEAMEELAKNLPKKGEVIPPLKSDSGKTTGGEKTAEQRLKERYPTMN